MNDSLTYEALAKRLGIDTSTVRRIIKKNGEQLGIVVQKGRSNTSNAKWTHYISSEDADRLIAFYESQNTDDGEESDQDAYQAFGFFYVIQLVPEALPDRIKIGYTDNLEQRLRDHQTSAPTATIIASWPCKRSWDFAAMDCITREGCKWILNEVWEGDRCRWEYHAPLRWRWPMPSCLLYPLSRLSSSILEREFPFRQEPAFVSPRLFGMIIYFSDHCSEPDS